MSSPKDREEKYYEIQFLLAMFLESIESTAVEGTWSVLGKSPDLASSEPGKSALAGISTVEMRKQGNRHRKVGVG